MTKKIAIKWLKQALHDLEMAEKTIAIGGYDVSAFLAHQSIEKLLKAIFAIRGRKTPKTHYIDELAKELKLKKELIDAISELSADYTFSRYPDVADRVLTNVIIRGTGFLRGARVIVGKRFATTEVKDDSTIEAVTPANPKGRLDVKVINPDTQEAVIPRVFVSVGELAYNYPNPFQASRGTTFRYVPGPNESVESIVVRIFNLAGVPIGVVGAEGSNEVRWQDSRVNVGLYVYLMEVRVGGKVKQFKRMLEVYK